MNMRKAFEIVTDADLHVHRLSMSTQPRDSSLIFV